MKMTNKKPKLASEINSYLLQCATTQQKKKRVVMMLAFRVSEWSNKIRSTRVLSGCW